MQAKNYAAQVKKENDYIQSFRFNEDSLSTLSDAGFFDIALNDSVNFSINDPYIFDDGFKGIIGTKIHLPYDKISISVDYGVSKLLIVCMNDSVCKNNKKTNDFFTVGAYIKNKLITKWIPFPFFVRIPLDFSSYVKKEDGCFKFYFETEPAFNGLSFSFVNEIDEMANPTKGLGLEFFRELVITTVLELIEALTCKNVEQTIIQKYDAALNARRVNKGKLPLYEERILTIKVNAKQGTGTRTGTHESPRQHLRRGHIRRLDTGNVWVNACVVGSSEKGVIKKSYNVAA